MRNELSSRRKELPGGFWFIWRMPLALALATVLGISAALLDAGPWRALAWAALALPLAVVVHRVVRSLCGERQLPPPGA